MELPKLKAPIDVPEASIFNEDFIDACSSIPQEELEILKLQEENFNKLLDHKTLEDKTVKIVEYTEDGKECSEMIEAYKDTLIYQEMIVSWKLDIL